jgi:hypothetical protein
MVNILNGQQSNPINCTSSSGSNNQTKRLKDSERSLFSFVQKVSTLGVQSTVLGAPFQSATVASVHNPQHTYASLASAVGQDMTNKTFMGSFFTRRCLMAGLSEVVHQLPPDVQAALKNAPFSTVFMMGATETALTYNLELKEVRQQTGKQFTPRPATAFMATIRNAPPYFFINAQTQYLEKTPTANGFLVSCVASAGITVTSLPPHSVFIKLHDGMSPKNVLQYLVTDSKTSNPKPFRQICKELIPPKAAGARFMRAITLLYPMTFYREARKSFDQEYG